MNMMVNAPLVSSLAQQDEDGEWVLMAKDRVDENGEDNLEFRELAQAMGMALTDLFVIASAIGADFVPLQKAAESANGWSASHWLLDMMTFWIEDEVEELDCVTPAGLELSALKEINTTLPARLIALQEHRFGAPLNVKLGEIWQKRP